MPKLLVGTYRSLMFWDGASHLITGGVHYGITWDGENVYASYNPPSGGTVIEVYDRYLGYRETLPIKPLDNVHQILWYKGTLYITNTLYNRVETWDGERQSKIVWGIEEFWKNDPPRDEMHINSLWCDGETWYACEHGYKRPPPRVRVFDRDFEERQVFELDWHDASPDLNLHNVYVEDGKMYLCRHDHIDVRNLKGKLLKRVYPLGKTSGFLLRGMARTADRFYIGASTYAPRERRGDGDSDILVLDGDLKLIDAYFLPNAGQIYEIRALDGVDRAHNGVWLNHE